MRLTLVFQLSSRITLGRIKSTMPNKHCAFCVENNYPLIKNTANSRYKLTVNYLIYKDLMYYFNPVCDLSETTPLVKVITTLAPDEPLIPDV